MNTEPENLNESPASPPAASSADEAPALAAPPAQPVAPAAPAPQTPGVDPRRRLRELLSVPERDRSDEQWDEINELEIQFAPGNRVHPGSPAGPVGVPSTGGGGGGGRHFQQKKHPPKGEKGPGGGGKRRPRPNKPQQG
ncbi:MAG: hypothetical protein IPG52_06575 [Rhodocyclaceae bacterium]|nr:hypothetical protein [Rhodocyclaceae bacterium]